MITLITDKINTFNQISYSKFLDTINFHQLSCSCAFSGCLIKHGFYKRSIKTPEGFITLSILRMKCKHCGKTHAIFPKFIVPYSQILLNDHLSILRAYTSNDSFELIMTANEYIDESNIRYVISRYLRYWKEPIAAFGFSITDDIVSIIRHCLSTFKRQFMQIKYIPNIIFT